MQLPASAQEIADVIGRDAALYLIGQLPRIYSPDKRVRPGRTGGRKTTVVMYVPKELAIKDRLVSILGWNDAVKLVREFAGMLIHPASCNEIYRPFRDRNMVRLVAEGVPIKTIAEWFDVSERTVKNVVAENPPHEYGAAANDNDRRTNNRMRAKR